MLNIGASNITLEKGPSGLYFGKDEAMPWALVAAPSEQEARDRLSEVRAITESGKILHTEMVKDHLFQKHMKGNTLILIPAPKAMTEAEYNDIWQRIQMLILLTRSTEGST